MNLNPAITSYTNLGITDSATQKQETKGFGLLSRNSSMKPKQTSNEPRDRVRDYVKSIRQARKQLKHG